MSLLAALLAIAEDWREVFPQQRTFQRGMRQALGSLVCLGRRCLSRIIWTSGLAWCKRFQLGSLKLPIASGSLSRSRLRFFFCSRF